MPDHAADRAAAITWARRMLANKALILDSETTGLADDAEIVQLSIINHRGITLFDTLVRPTIAIPPDASALHGIDDAAVRDAPAFSEVYEELWQVVRNRQIVIYNKDYDTARLRWCCKLANVQVPYRVADTHCAMLMYSQWVGEWNDYRKSYRWQKLEGGDHSAIGDCRATLAIMRRMAEEST